MDISSAYFARLRQPSLYWVVYLWRFLLVIRRVGKARELVSFIWWEIHHRLWFYRIGRQYIRFSDKPFFSLTDNATLSANPSFAQLGLHFKTLAVDWQYCVEMTDGTRWGCCFSNPKQLCFSDDQSQSAVVVYTFNRPIRSLFVSSQNRIFVCLDGAIYKSDDRGKSFVVVLKLSTPISYFLFNRGMTELPDHRLLIGEYGSIWHGKNWQNLAYLYHSSDGGDTWHTSDFLLRQGVNKHVHLVKYSALLKTVFLMDGDNKKQAWMNTSLTEFDSQADKQTTGWQLLNAYHHQTGGYMCMAETNEAVLFGSDYLGGTNFIVSTTNGKQFKKLVLPDPYRRSPVMNMTVRQATAGLEVWAVSYSCLSGKAKSLLMFTRDGGKTWVPVIEFDGTRHEVRIVNSSTDPSGRLYLSITEFSPKSGPHRHWVYSVEQLTARQDESQRMTGLNQRVPQHIPVQANKQHDYYSEEYRYPAGVDESVLF